jgi:hypothetical protein
VHTANDAAPRTAKNQARNGTVKSFLKFGAHSMLSKQ